MDTRLKGVIEGLHAIGGEEEDALEVFEQAEEDADKGIATYVLSLAGLEEDVSFVQQENCAPRMSDIQDFIELCF